jgi:perosamine synthetase
MKRIPVASPDLTGNENAYVSEAIRSTWISSAGKFLERFEAEFASLCGSSSALGVCNGTVALHLALLALDVRPGDEVLVPSLTYIATANAVRYVGAEPVFVDVDPATWCIDPAGISDAITRRTRGIIAVHLMGHPADMDVINHIAVTHGLWVVEDAAEAHLARYKGRTVGSLAKVGTFSFFGNKIFTCGEGGAVTTSDQQLEVRMRMLRGQGMDPDKRYFFPITGYNYRMTNLAAALLCAQLERREEIVERRRAIFARYQELLKEIPGIGFQPVAPWAEVSPWMFAITVNPREFGCSREDLMACLAARGVETRPMFLPLHHMPPFREQARQRDEVLPVTDRLGSDGIMLPTFSQLSDADLEYVVEAIASAQGVSREVLLSFVRKAGAA